MTFDELKKRGFIDTLNDEDLARRKIDEEKITFYLGIDPTANSMHIGHFFPLVLVKKLQEMGHKPIILVGGATAQIGDPSGRGTMRNLLSSEVVEKNKEALKKMLEKYLDFEGDNKAIIVDNYEWMCNFSYIDFMRYVGTHFNVSSMLKTDIYKKRLEEGGLTFFEMGYVLMQSYDFHYLKENYDCVMQIGGTDQWVNILSGTTLHKKITGKDEELIALTVPLLTTADGLKMGKTAGNALWIDEEKVSPYEFYQAFINMDDRDVEKLLKLFSDYPLDEISEMVNDDIQRAKEKMAYSVCKLVHGKEKADEALKVSKEVFEDKDFSNLEEFKTNFPVNILELLTESNICKSRGEARRLIEQKGIRVDGETIDSFNFNLEKESVLQKGKKIYLKITKK